MADPIRLGPFKGAAVAPEPKLLPVEVGADSSNHNPERGDLRPWKTPATVAMIPASRETIYRFGRDLTSESTYWMSWNGAVHLVRAQIADDVDERTYLSGDGAPKVVDATISIASAPYPTATRDLGVPQPTGKPTLTQTVAGTGDDETRYYLYVFVTDRGEISAPSPVSDPITCKPGALINITTIDAVPAGAHGINRVWIYRTVAGESAAEFFFLRELVAATSSTDDARTPGADRLLSNGPAGTTGRAWLVPPTDLSCLTGLWNQMIAGITGRSIRYCEPGRGYAWPAAYETLCEDTPRALAVFQRNLLILTTGKPLLATGSAPEAIEAVPVEFIAACISVQSVVAFGHGVCWATSDGLAYVGTNGTPRLLTDGLLTKSQWITLNPTSMIAAQYQGKYVAFYLVDGGWLGFMLDPLDPTGIYFISPGYSGCYFDPLQEALYVLDGTSVKKWDPEDGAPLTVTFKSKVFRTPHPTNYAVAELVAESWPWRFEMWADGVYTEDRSITNGDAFNLKGGYLASRFQFQLSGTGNLQGMVVAHDVTDLGLS